MRKGVYVGRNSRTARKIGTTYVLGLGFGGHKEIHGRYFGRLSKMGEGIILNPEEADDLRVYLYDSHGRPFGHGPALIDGSVSFGRIEGNFRSSGPWKLHV